jgi:hypothetical protein
VIEDQEMMSCEGNTPVPFVIRGVPEEDTTSRKMVIGGSGAEEKKKWVWVHESS